jgi:hypothetical protein
MTRETPRLGQVRKSQRIDATGVRVRAQADRTLIVGYPGDLGMVISLCYTELR